MATKPALPCTFIVVLWSFIGCGSDGGRRATSAKNPDVAESSEKSAEVPTSKPPIKESPREILPASTGGHEFFPVRFEAQYGYTHSVVKGVRQITYDRSGRFGSEFYRVRDGALETAVDSAVDIPQDWVVVLPEHCKEGESWTSASPSGLRQTTGTCLSITTWTNPPEKLKQFRGRKLIRVRQDNAVVAAGRTIFSGSWVREFVSGVGLVRIEFFPTPRLDDPVVRELVSVTEP